METTATAADTLREHQAEAREQVRRAIIAGESGGAIVTRAMRALMPSDEVGAMESEAEAIRAKLAELGDEPPELANVGDVVTAAAKAAKDLKKLHTQLADCLARAEAARDGLRAEVNRDMLRAGLKTPMPGDVPRGAGGTRFLVTEYLYERRDSADLHDGDAVVQIRAHNIVDTPMEEA